MWNLDDVKSLMSDTFFNCFAILLSAGITAGFLMRDFSYWWIPAVICFLFIGRFVDEVEEEKMELLKNDYKHWSKQKHLTEAQLDVMAKDVLDKIKFREDWREYEKLDAWQDYKCLYEETDSSNCNICGYATQGCVCKPVVDNKSEV